MSAMDKVHNKVEEVIGKIKEKTGQATGDDKLRTHGKTDQTKSNLKQSGEHIKDALS